MTGTWPTGWATGDIETAAEFKKGIGSISDTTLGGSAANIDITSISATYAHLLVVAYTRGDAAAASTGLRLQFNGDTAANYDSQSLTGNAALTIAGEAFGLTVLGAGSIPANTAGANLFSANVLFIPHYAGAANNKVCLALNSLKVGTTTGLLFSIFQHGFWRSNAAINRITFLPTTGNFVAGTRITIYGMGA